METTNNVNLNQADCLRSVADFGQTTVHNICNGKLSVIPWGSVDWAVAFGLMAFFVVIVCLFGGIALSIIRNRF